MKLRNADTLDEMLIDVALDHLRLARIALSAAGARKSAARVSASIKSADGALRHTRRIVDRNKGD